MLRLRKYFSFGILIFILVAGFFLRFYRVSEIPPSLNWDEVSIGYNAYSILKTGKDEWGEFLPLHFKSYGEYKLPVQIYASIPGIAMFGLNEFGVRITPVVYGTLTILLLFLLTRELFNRVSIALVASSLLAISPWHIHLTRGNFESSFSVFWVTLGVWLLVKGMKESGRYLVVSMIAFATAIYTYNSARVFVPMFLFVLFFVYLKNWHKKISWVVISMIVMGFLLVPLVPFVLSGEGGARYKLVSVTDDPGLVLRVNENRGNSSLPAVLARIVHNKITYTVSAVLSNYTAHFTPQYLFISGAPHKQHHVQGVGQLYLFQAPFLLFGLYSLFRKKLELKWGLILWILIAFVPVSVTNDSIPHALRTVIAVVPYQIITAVGVVALFEIILRKKTIFVSGVGLLILVVMVSVGSYLINYYTVYPKLYSRDWQYGYQQAVDFVNKHKDDYDKVVFTRHYGEPHMFTLFFQNYDPAKFQNDPNLNRFETYDWVRVLSFDKYYFPDLGDQGSRYEDVVKQFPDQRLLFIGKPGDFPVERTVLYEVKFLNGQSAFQIVDNT